MNRFTTCRLIIIMLMAFTKPINAGHDTVVLTNERNVIKLDDYIEILIDKNSEWKITDITSKHHEEWIKPKKINFGFFKSIIWCRFNIGNNSEITNWMLVDNYGVQYYDYFS